ncbi:MAG: hypothetical protein JRG81_11230 [Deltaproteobacteria bacterium]|nr:hypothetical protein [Deltaproteobacteria bacterium]
MSQLIETPISVTEMIRLRKLAKELGYVSAASLLRTLNQIIKEHPETKLLLSNINNGN